MRIETDTIPKTVKLTRTGNSQVDTHNTVQSQRKSLTV